MSEKIFECDKCGICCQNVNRSIVYVDFDRGDGICKNYDEATHLCKIYSRRPIICNVDAYYEKFLRKVMSREKFHALNYAACNKMRQKNFE